MREVVFHCGFLLHFPNEQPCLASFHILIGYFCIFFGAVFVQVFFLFKWIVFLIIKLYVFFVYFILWSVKSFSHFKWIVCILTTQL